LEDQSLWETIDSDSGSTTANSATDTLTVAGGTGITTAIAGDTLTITNSSPNVDQNLWATIDGDSGSTTANTTTDTLTIAGGTGITTAVSGDTITITASGGGSGTMNTVKEDGTPVGDADIVTLDFTSPLTASESPDTEINIGFDYSVNNTWTGENIFTNSVEIPNGAGGTTINTAGEVCIDTTSDTLNFHDGTAERVLTPIYSKSIDIEDPTSSEDISMFYSDEAMTISKMVCVLVGSSTPSVTWTVRHGTDRSAAGSEVVTGGTTTTSTSTGSVVTSFDDATVVADSFLWIETTAQSGTVDEMKITIFYRQDA
jgi:hypothetical protein